MAHTDSTTPSDVRPQAPVGGDKIKTRTQVKCTRLLVDSSQIMQFALKPGGGAAMQLVPVTDQEIKEYKKYKGQVL